MRKLRRWGLTIGFPGLVYWASGSAAFPGSLGSVEILSFRPCINKALRCSVEGKVLLVGGVVGQSL